MNRSLQTKRQDHGIVIGRNYDTQLFTTLKTDHGDNTQVDEKLNLVP